MLKSIEISPKDPALHIEWPQVRIVILNDRNEGYRPDRATIRKLRRILPTAKIIGFKPYYQTTWVLLVECDRFYPVYMGGIQITSMSELSKNNFDQLPPSIPPVTPAG